MTAREARNRRRAEERREAKLARKAANSPNAQSTPPVPAFNPEIENEFPRELQAEANRVRDRIHRNIGLNPAHGFVSHAETNRLNAQHSTGPKSPQGKLASSRNSLKHGLASGTIIVPGEDPAAFEALLHDLLEEHQPANTTEDLLIHEMAQSHWLAQRALRFQNQCFTEDGVDEKRLSLFLRYQTTHNRAFHKALATLLKVKKERGVSSGSGFVSQSPAPPQNATTIIPQNDREIPAVQANPDNFFSQKRHNKTTEAA